MTQLIFRYGDASEELIEAATDGSRKQPFESTQFDRHLRGTLVGARDELAAEGQEYPYHEWRSEIERFEGTDDGSYDMEVTDSITGRFGEGVTFQPDSHKVYGPKMNP